MAEFKGWYLEMIEGRSIANVRPTHSVPVPSYVHEDPKTCPDCGGTRLLTLLVDCDPPLIECRDCRHQDGVNLYLKYKFLVQSYGARARPQHHEKLAQMKLDYGLTDEEAAREPGPEHDLSRMGGTFVMGEIQPLDTLKKHECSKCGDWMVRMPSPLLPNPPARDQYRCPSCNHRTVL